MRTNLDRLIASGASHYVMARPQRYPEVTGSLIEARPCGYLVSIGRVVDPDTFAKRAAPILAKR